MINQMRVAFVVGLVAVLLFGGIGLVAADDVGETPDSEAIDLVVKLEEIDSFDSAEDLKRQTEESQKPVVEYLKGIEGVTVQRQLWLTNSILTTVDTAVVDPSTIADHPDIIAVESDQEVEAPDPATDIGTHSTPTAPSTYGLEQINALNAWERFETQGEGITVGVVDTGINPDHVTLELDGDASNNYLGAWHTLYYPNGSAVPVSDREGSTAPAPFDATGHGTHVSGTAVGGSVSDISIGVAPGARLINSAALTEIGGTTTGVTQSLEWMVEQDVDVVTMSLGGQGVDSSMIDQLNTMRDLGIVVVASSGNGGDGEIYFPAGYEPAIAVGATGESESVLSTSSGGEYYLDEKGLSDKNWDNPQRTPDVVAPGGNVWSASDTSDTGLSRKTGTSMAAPHVSGVIALMLSNNPELHNLASEDPTLFFEEMMFILRESTVPASGHPDTDQWNSRSGYGIVNAQNALALSNLEGYLIVDSIDAPAGIEFGETLTVKANVTNLNVFDDAADRDVTLILDGEDVETKNVVVEAGETQELTFEYETTEDDVDIDRIVISTGDDDDSVGVTIAGPAEFKPTIEPENVPEPFVVGEETSFNVTVENIGGIPDTGNLSLYINESLIVDGDSNIPEIGADETADVEFTYTATEDDLSVINITAVTDTHEVEYFADVAMPASFEPTIDRSATTEFIAGQTATVSVDVENLGGVADTGDLDLFINGTQVEEGQDNIPTTEVGEQSTVELTYDVSEVDYPAVEVRVESSGGSSTEVFDVLLPAESEVSVAPIDSPVKGDPIVVDITVENIGDFPLEQEVLTSISGIGVNQTIVQLGGRESTEFTTTFDTDANHVDHGSYTAEISTPNSSISVPFDVLRKATFDVTIDSITTPVSAGDSGTATVGVENIGDVSGTETITLANDETDEVLDSNETTLDAGETEQLLFEYDTEVDDTGDLTLVVESTDSTATTTVVIEGPNPPEITDVEADHDPAQEVVTVKGTITPGSLDVDSVVFRLDANFTSYSNTSAVDSDVSSSGELSVDIPVDHLVGDGRYTPVGIVVDNASQEVIGTGSAITIDTTPPELRLDTEDLVTGNGNLLIEADEDFEIVGVNIEADDSTDRSPDVSTIPTGIQTKDTTVSIGFDSDSTPTAGVTSFEITVDAEDESGNTATETLTATVKSYDLVDGKGTVSPSANSPINVIGNATQLGGTVSRDATVSTSRTSPAGTNLNVNQFSGGFINVNNIGLSDTELENATLYMSLDDLDQEIVSKFDVEDLVIFKSDEGSSEYYPIETEYNSTANALVATVDGFSQFGGGGTDTTAPEIDSVSVTPGTDIESDDGPVTVVFEYSDKQSGVNVSETEVTANIDSSRFSTTTTSTESEIEVTGLSDGETIEVTLTVADNAGNIATEVVTIEVDDESGSGDSGGSGGSGSSGGSSSGGSSGGGGGSGSGVRSANPTPFPDDVSIIARAKGRISNADGYSFARPGDFLTNPVLETVIWNDPDVAGEIEVRDYDGVPARAGTPPGELVSAHEIMVPHHLRENTSTLRFNLNKLDASEEYLSGLDRDKLTVWNDVNGDWQALETRIVEDTGEALVIEADVDHYSHLAVTLGDGDMVSKDGQEEVTPESETTAEIDDETPGFGIGMTLVALGILHLMTHMLRQKP